MVIERTNSSHTTTRSEAAVTVRPLQKDRSGQFVSYARQQRVARRWISPETRMSSSVCVYCGFCHSVCVQRRLVGKPQRISWGSWILKNCNTCTRWECCCLFVCLISLTLTNTFAWIAFFSNHTKQCRHTFAVNVWNFFKAVFQQLESPLPRMLTPRLLPLSPGFMCVIFHRQASATTTKTLCKTLVFSFEWYNWLRYVWTHVCVVNVWCSAHHHREVFDAWHVSVIHVALNKWIVVTNSFPRISVAKDKIGWQNNAKFWARKKKNHHSLWGSLTCGRKQRTHTPSRRQKFHSHRSKDETRGWTGGSKGGVPVNSRYFSRHLVKQGCVIEQELLFSGENQSSATMRAHYDWLPGRGFVQIVFWYSEGNRRPFSKRLIKNTRIPTLQNLGSKNNSLSILYYCFYPTSQSMEGWGGTKMFKTEFAKTNTLVQCILPIRVPRWVQQMISGPRAQDPLGWCLTKQTSVRVHMVVSLWNISPNKQTTCQGEFCRLAADSKCWAQCSTIRLFVSNMWFCFHSSKLLCHTKPSSEWLWDSSVQTTGDRRGAIHLEKIQYLCLCSKLHPFYGVQRLHEFSCKTDVYMQENTIVLDSEMSLKVAHSRNATCFACQKQVPKIGFFMKGGETTGHLQTLEDGTGSNLQDRGLKPQGSNRATINNSIFTKVAGLGAVLIQEKCCGCRLI